MMMPFRSFAFLASIAVVTHITSTSEIARPLIEDANTTGSDPLSVTDLSGAPANNVSSTHNTTVDEERMAGRGTLVLLRGVMKTVLLKLYGASKNVLTPTGLGAVITVDEKLLRRVERLPKSNDTEKKTIFPGASQELSVEPLTNLIRVSEQLHYADRLKTMKNNIVEWMQDQSLNELAKVLNEHRFFEFISYANVYVVSVYLKESIAEQKTAYPLLGTLLEGFGGAARLTIAQGALQLEICWLVSRGITYENLDTFVQYVVLTSGRNSDVFLIVLKCPRGELDGDVNVVRAIIQGKKAGGGSSASYLCARYGDVNIGSRQEPMVKHNEYAKVFEKELAAQCTT